MPEQNNDAPKALSRRAAITAVAAVPLSAQLSVGLAAVGDEVAQLARRMRPSCAATWIAGSVSPILRRTSR